MPPFAVSSSPTLSFTAPVKAPFTCPNISDSSSPSGSAAQLTATSGRALRRLSRWMSCAITSLPTPLSPVMNTDASVGATRRAMPTTLWNAGETPISEAPAAAAPASPSAPARRSPDSRATNTVCAARPIRISRCVAEKGFGR